jgi:hypothetical protein
MGGFFDPIDFSGIVGYPHDISEDAIDNIPEFDHNHASAHIVAFTKFIHKWCDPPIYEDVLMRLFVFTLVRDREMFWFQDLPDKTFKTIQELLHAFLDMFGCGQQELHCELVENFMETWKFKNLSHMETISSDSEVDFPSNPIEDFNESVQNMQLSQEEPCETVNEQFMAVEDQLEIMEDDFTETYIEYSDPHGLQLDSKKDEEVCVEIADEYIDEPVIYFEEVKEIKFENVEYPDDLSSHPPPDEPVVLNVDFENSMMVPVIGSSSVVQPEDLLMQNCMIMEGNFSLSMSNHYDSWLASHLDSHEQQSIQILHSLSYSSVWLKGRRIMVLGWFFLVKSSKLIRLGKGSSVSHPGLGLFRHLWHHFTHSLGGCNVSLTLPCIFMLYYFNLICHYVLRIFFSFVVSICSYNVVL